MSKAVSRLVKKLTKKILFSEINLVYTTKSCFSVPLSAHNKGNFH